MSQIDKGLISTFEADKDSNGNFTKCRVLPASAQSMPTRPLIIPWYLRGKMANLKVNDEVWFALADDLSGIVLERADGEWGAFVPGSFEVEKNLEVGTEATIGGIAFTTHVHPNGHEGADTGAPK